MWHQSMKYEGISHPREEFPQKLMYLSHIL